MKKKIPLQVLEILEPFLKKESVLFHTIDPGNFLLKFKDKDDKSDFYFNIEEYRLEGDLLLLLDFKPFNKLSTDNKRVRINATQLEAYFSAWSELLYGYQQINSIYDDPILEAFTKEFYTEFKSVDVDSDINPFSTKQILLLDEYLEYVENEIENYQTENNKIEIQAIKQDVIELRESLTKKSKKWVTQKFSLICAKLSKQGPKLIKEFLSESKKLAIKEGIKILYEKAIEIVS